MKRIFYLLVLIGVSFTACDPMEDIYKDIDSVDKPVVGSDEFTMSPDDYADLDSSSSEDYYEVNESFSSMEDAGLVLPAFLSDKYPLWGEGSSVVVNFNLIDGNPESVSGFTSAETYQLSTADYAASGSDAFGYYPDTDAAEEIIAILENQIEAPTEGQIVLATYRQYLEVPEVGFATLYEYGFNGTLDEFESVNLIGDQVWEAASFGGVEYAYMSGYAGGSVVNEDWLISPEMNLSGETDIRVQINQAINYASDLALLGVWVSSDYTTGGDVSSATWELIDFANAPAGNNWSFVLSEDYDLSAYDGQTVHIAFRYESTVDEAASWEIDQLLVKALGVSGDYDSKGEYFVFSDGAWETMDEVYYLSTKDYDSMGTGSGQPGQYNNFSGTVLPENYVPQFLGMEYPYAQEEDELYVIYKYYNGSSTVVKGNLFTFSEGIWVPSISSLQFGFEDGVWVPDNTIRYTLTSSDFDAISEEFQDVYPGPASSAGNYNNFDRRAGNANEWTNDMILEALNFILDGLDPNAEEGQKYLVTADIYNGTNTTEDFAVIKSGGIWVYQ